VITPEEIVEVSHGWSLLPAALAGQRRPSRAGFLGEVRIDLLDWQMHVGRAALSPALAVEWNALCAQSIEASPFVTPTWLEAWLNAFHPDAELVLLTARRCGALCGILPLLRRQHGIGPLRITRLTAPFNLHGFQANMVVCPEDREYVVSGARDFLRDCVDWQVIDYRDTPENGAFALLSHQYQRDGLPVLRRFVKEAPVIPLTATTSINSMGPAKDIRRYGRLLVRDGQPSYRAHRYPPETVVDRFFEIEASGWKGEQGSAIAQHDDLRRFYRALMHQTGEAWVPVIHELRLDNVVIAMCLGIEAGQSWYELKSAYRESHRRYGPGHVLMWEVANDLLQRGLTSYELLGQMEPYKARWTSQTRPHHHYLIFRPSFTGQLFARSVAAAILAIKWWRTFSMGGSIKKLWR
jgi:CelD/BcsL family acetyltransferase involved in cellulose biosynthesis